MKLLKATVKNFGSYDELELDFENQGLTLISGPTGSGKSTLCDIVPWILFGCTAKDGAVDEVRSWSVDGNTEGRLGLTLPDGTHIDVVRIRGPKANDLYWLEECVWEHPIRGKDLSDTQKLLENRLSITKEAYLMGTYYHEFLEAARFFTAKAKDRRVLTESLADLSLAVKITDSLKSYNKEINSERVGILTTLGIKDAEIKQIKEIIQRDSAKSKSWIANRDLQYSATQKAFEDFDKDKNKIVSKLVEKSVQWHSEWSIKVKEAKAEVESLTAEIEKQSDFTAEKADIKSQIEACSTEVCGECGAPKGLEKKSRLTARLHVIEKEELKNKQLANSLRGANITLKSLLTQTDPHASLIEREKASTNVYGQQLGDLKEAQDPYFKSIQENDSRRIALVAERNRLQDAANAIMDEEQDVELLLDITGEFRATQIKNTIIELENKTNDLLTKHFDAEIRVKFSVEAADKVEVIITKDGNLCTFTQLSKGQRCLLKLCFGVSVMTVVSNHHGVSFSTVFFDEALDGLDETLKIKAFSLFSELAVKYENVFVVEHAESLKPFFNNQYQVRLVNGRSEIER